MGASRDDPMTHDPTDIPAEPRISLDAVPLVETRAIVGREFNQCHAPTVAGRYACSTSPWRPEFHRTKRAARPVRSCLLPLGDM
jgi:hypothetical protein